MHGDSSAEWEIVGFEEREVGTGGVVVFVLLWVYPFDIEVHKSWWKSAPEVVVVARTTALAT